MKDLYIKYKSEIATYFAEDSSRFSLYASYRSFDLFLSASFYEFLRISGLKGNTYWISYFLDFVILERYRWLNFLVISLISSCLKYFDYDEPITIRAKLHSFYFEVRVLLPLNISLENEDSNSSLLFEPLLLFRSILKIILTIETHVVKLISITLLVNC